MRSICFSQLPVVWAIILAGSSVGVALLSGCSDEVIVGPAPSADAATTAASADAAAADAAASAAVPTVVGASHTKSPYVEISGEWQVASERLLVNVWVGGFTDLLGLAGHLRYDPTLLQLTGNEALPLTEDSASTGFQYRAVLKEPKPGQLLTGTARFRTLSHPYMYPEGAEVGRALWLKLEFAVLAPGKSVIAFDPLTQMARNGKGELLTPQWMTAEVTAPDTAGGGK